MRVSHDFKFTWGMHINKLCCFYFECIAWIWLLYIIFITILFSVLILNLDCLNSSAYFLPYIPTHTHRYKQNLWILNCELFHILPCSKSINGLLKYLQENPKFLPWHMMYDDLTPTWSYFQTPGSLQCHTWPSLVHHMFSPRPQS